MLRTIRQSRPGKPNIAGRAALTAPVLLAGALLFPLTGCGSGSAKPSLFSTSTGTPTPMPSATPTTPVVTGNLVPPYLNKVAFISQRNTDERGRLYVMNPDGSQVTAIKPLSHFSDLNLRYPDSHYMSADGSRFLFTFDIGTGSGSVNYFVSADGTNERNITALFDPSAATNSIGAGHVSDISMNANGTQFVFPYYPGLGSSGNFDSLIRLVTMNADGSARTTRYTALANQQIFSPIFAPDGQTIYFILTTSLVDNANVYTYTGIVYRLAPGATVPVAVTALSLKSGVNNADAVVFPELSINADGTKLAFINYVGSSDEIFVVGTDGTGLTRLTTNAALDASPSFTTDGLKIIFTSYRDGNAELYSINPDGTGETRLTYEIEPDTYPATRAKKAASAASRKAVSR